MSVAGVLTVLGALGSAATLHGYYKSRLSVSPETSSITDNGLDMPIKVSNDGLLSVNDIRFSCFYKNAVAGRVKMEDVMTEDFPTQSVAEIMPGHPVTVLCLGGGGDAQLFSTYGPSSEVEMEINVSFRPSFYFWQKSDTFKFTGTRGPDGVFHWMPH